MKAIARVTTVVTLLAGAAWVPALAAETDFDAEAELQLGYDSNPLRLATNEQGGAFAELTLDAGLDVEVNPKFTFLGGVDVTDLRFSGDVSDAGTTDADLEAGVELTPYRSGGRRLTFVAGGRFLVRRSTFTSRASGRVFRAVDDVTGSPVPIPDRFDSDTTELFLDAEWRVNRRARVFLNAARRDRDYTEDYTSVAGVESLDYESTMLEPGVRFRLGERGSVELSYAHRQRDYKTRTSRDTLGDSVAGTRREYRYGRFGAEFRFAPSERTRLRLGLASQDREDAYAGYYNYSGTVAFAAARIKVGESGRFRGSVVFRDRDYDHATVNNQVGGEIRSSDVTRLAVDYEREVGDRFSWNVEFGQRSSGNQNPVFAYDRTWVAAGVAVRR